MMKLSDYDIRQKMELAFPKTIYRCRSMDSSIDSIYNQCYRDYILDCANNKISCLKFVNMHIFKINENIDLKYIEKIQRIKKEEGVDIAVLYNLNMKEVMEIQRNYCCPYNFLYINECELQKYCIKSNYRRKARKAEQILNYEILPPSRKLILSGLKLYYKMDFSNSALEMNDEERVIDFYLDEDIETIRLACYYNKKMAGIMLGYIWQRVAYMHIFFYNPIYTAYYISDLLYQQFIFEAQKKHVDRIIWGEEAPEDEGLRRFKNHYSTSCNKSYFCVI